MKFILILIFSAALYAGVDSTSVKPQSLCPVMDSEINKKLYVDYKGQRIYVCCRGCITPIKKDPEKYLKIIKDRGESVEVLKKKGG
ncbi:MAG: hypothetical protein JNL74_19730 [Fibrobacteres bacterium]|nr:hypothetical protein [Fibrobacterota bacterium]